MSGVVTSSSRAAGAIAVVAVGGVLALAGAASIIPILSDDCAASSPEPSSTAEAAIPADYLEHYRLAGAAYTVPWAVLAGIGVIESNHGRLKAPGVRSGVNAFGCCAGPMQFNLRDGPPSTWQSYRVDGDDDGDTDPYNPADAISSAANYLRTLLERAGGDIRAAIFGYNHSSAYVADVLERARGYSRTPDSALTPPPTTRCSGGSGDTSADLREAVRIDSPRRYAMLPTWAMAASRPTQPIDARLLDNALWLLRNYRLRVTAAREGGHNTHGDGTALDLIPAEPVDQAAWDSSAGALARDLGWRPSCGASGVRPICPLVPAIQFVGYEGFPGHGSPRTCRAPACAAHLHISWTSPCYGTSTPSAPCPWVTAMTHRAEAATNGAR